MASNALGEVVPLPSHIAALASKSSGLGRRERFKGLVEESEWRIDVTFKERKFLSSELELVTKESEHFRCELEYLFRESERRP